DRLEDIRFLLPDDGSAPTARGAVGGKGSALVGGVGLWCESGQGMRGSQGNFPQGARIPASATGSGQAAGPRAARRPGPNRPRSSVPDAAGAVVSPGQAPSAPGRPSSRTKLARVRIGAPGRLT